MKTLRRIALLFVVLVVFVGYPIVSLLGYNTLSISNRKYPPLTPDIPYEDVTFPTREGGYNVHAFYMPGKPDFPAIIAVHGWRGSRHSENDIKRNTALAGEGYTVLAVDLADSGGDTVGNGRLAMGYEERYDVLGAFDYLLSRGFAPDRIGLWGVSMGASTSLLAAQIEPRLRAVIADSGYTRADTIASEQAESFGFPRIIVPGGMLWGVVLTGKAIWTTAAIEAGKDFAANKQAIQLVHCTTDSFIVVRHADDLLAAYQAAGVDVDLWKIDCVGQQNPPPGTTNNRHGIGYFEQPEEYMRRLNAFFAAHLGKG
ncbi:MAG TPA: prolyl oligopeptidase family serine peptidase [Aggregatilineales bacterium]|nr:prolyl oligopeptidase family serine peptidase [Anaerolineales bacterium]HRE47518.1 prolyl oligopeptidase family serine peptidase [Aggregatilineales bacterium]